MTASLQIDRMQPGQTALIVAIDRLGLDPMTARRLHELGFDSGVDVEVVHRASFGGDPLAIRVGNMVVALRRSMAALIEVELLAEGRASEIHAPESQIA